MTLSLPELFSATAWGLAVAVLILAGARWRRGRGRRSRLAALNLGPTRPIADARAPRFSPRSYSAALGKALGMRSAASLDGLAELIDGAGLTGRIAPAEIMGWKLIATALALLCTIGLCLMDWRFGLLLPVLALAGWSAPTMWLRYTRGVRLNQILRDLPTVIDLLALSLEAGMGLDRALGIICDRVESPLSAELQHVLNDIGLGMSRHEAFEQLSARVRSDDVRLLSSSIIQSEQLGSSLVTTTRNHARLLRIGRRRRAETEALKAPVKMLFPMVLFILPTLFLVVLGPPALNLTHALAQGHP